MRANEVFGHGVSRWPAEAFIAFALVVAATAALADCS
jgi:hypothetical protein